MFDRGLSTALTVQNPEGEGAGGFSFQALLHTYIRLPDGDSIQNLRVRGFYTHSYIDKLLPASAGWKEHIQSHRLSHYHYRYSLYSLVLCWC
jgi:hypothetical protein